VIDLKLVDLNSDWSKFLPQNFLNLKNEMIKNVVKAKDDIVIRVFKECTGEELMLKTPNAKERIQLYSYIGSQDSLLVIDGVTRGAIITRFEHSKINIIFDSTILDSYSLMKYNEFSSTSSLQEIH